MTLSNEAPEEECDDDQGDDDERCGRGEPKPSVLFRRGHGQLGAHRPRLQFSARAAPRMHCVIYPVSMVVDRRTWLLGCGEAGERASQGTRAQASEPSGCQRHLRPGPVAVPWWHVPKTSMNRVRAWWHL